MNKKMLGRIALSIIVPVLFIVVIIWVIYEKKKPIISDSGKMAFGTTAPTRYIFIQSPSGNDFYFDVSADTLKTGGTLSPDSAAQIFIDYCAERYSGRIRELRYEIERLRQQATISQNGFKVHGKNVIMSVDTCDVFTLYFDTNYVAIHSGDSIHIDTDLPMTEAKRLISERLRELNWSQFAVGDSVAVILYDDNGIWNGNYFGRIVGKSRFTNCYLVKSSNTLRQGGIDYSWIDAVNLEKTP